MKGPPIRLSRSTAALLTTMLAVSGLPSLSASGASNPEITDASGDVSPSAFFMDTDSNQGAFENLTAYDLEKVYVLLETSTDLLIQFQVRDLPDKWALPPAIPADEGLSEAGAGPNASQPAVVLAANFTVRGVSYEAAANLSQPTSQGVRDSYSIARAGSAPVPVSGSYDVAADTVTLAIRKALLGSPRFGEVLSQFRSEGRFGDAKLDFAPDAVNYAPGTPTDPNLVAIILEKLTGQQLVQPKYGANYTFAFRAGSGLIELSSAQTERTVGPGGTAVYSFDVRNRGGASDTVFFTLSDAAVGYQHRLSTTEIDLDPGEAKSVQVTVSTAPAARGDVISIVEARSRLGDTDSLIFETSIVEGAPTSTTGQTNPVEATNNPVNDPSSQAPFTPTRERTKDVPGVEALAVVAALVALVALMRRRT